MDPTIEALTIYPAAWAALLEGLIHGLAYGLAIIASILVIVAALLACLGGRARAAERLVGVTSGAEGAWSFPAPVDPAPVGGRAPHSLGGLVPAVWSQHRTPAGRRRRRSRR
jgi:hypothetical protein